MTYQHTLADKMRNQFRGRGAALSGMQASSTSELVRRAGMGRDPRVNCAEQAFREQQMRRSGGRNEYSGNDAMYTAVYPVIPEMKRTQRTQNNTRTNPRNTRAQSTRAQRPAQEAQQKRAPKMEPITPSLELPVKKKFLSPVFVAMLLVSTFMIMFLVMSISDIYETTNRIADLENEIATLTSDAEELELLLEEKNDIRLIEEIATTQLGMTKEDSLQRRYVSLSDGEHIDILEVEEEEENGVLLSSVFSSIGDLFR